MNPVAAGLSLFAVIAGLLLVVDGLHPRDRGLSTAPSTRLWTTVENWWARQTRRSRTQLVGSGVFAVVAFLITGWPIVLVALPLATVGLPALLSEPRNRDIEILEALDRWVRALAASLPTGKSIPDAIRTTCGQAPGLLRAPLRVMVARLDARWTTREALLALADDLDCPDADAVLAALVLAAQRGGVGATSILDELADTIQARLRALREIEAERAKPRVVVRQVTMISLVAIGLALLTQPDYFRPYRTPLGQVIMLAELACYLASLAFMRRLTRPRRRERILRRANHAQEVGSSA